MTRGPFKRRFSALVLLAVSLASIRYGTKIPFVQRNKLLWISTAVMAFMIRQVLQKRSSKLIIDPSVVGNKADDAKEGDFKEYDFVIVGGGESPIFVPFFLTNMMNNV